jgi:hypothetical protein
MLSLTFLTGDSETGRKSPSKFNRRPLQIMRKKGMGIKVTSSHFDKEIINEKLSQSDNEFLFN